MAPKRENFLGSGSGSGSGSAFFQNARVVVVDAVRAPREVGVEERASRVANAARSAGEVANMRDVSSALESADNADERRERYNHRARARRRADGYMDIGNFNK